MQTQEQAKKAKSKAKDAEATEGGLHLRKIEGQPIVELIYDRRTLTDRRLATLRVNPHAWSLVSTYANVQLETYGGQTFLRGFTCGGCGQSEVTTEGHGCVRRVHGTCQ